MRRIGASENTVDKMEYDVEKFNKKVEISTYLNGHHMPRVMSTFEKRRTMIFALSTHVCKYPMTETSSRMDLRVFGYKKNYTHAQFH